MVAQIDKAYARASLTKTLVRLLSYGLFEGRPLTTRGRWINPLVMAQAALVKKLPQLKAVKKPIFIVGTGRSGTTILGLILSLHHDVAFLNEPKAQWHAAYAGEDLVGNFTEDAARYRLGEDAAEPAVKQAMQRLYGAYLGMTGSRRILDKYPELIFRVPFVKAIFPDARFLFLQRNGVDTCRSISHWSERLGSNEGQTVDWWGVDNRKWQLMVEELVRHDDLLAPHYAAISGFTRHDDMAAVEWILSMREGMALQAQYPDELLAVRYEDLVESSDETLQTLFEFCDLSFNPTVTDYARQVLQSNSSAATELQLDESIRPAFAETMTQLGYQPPGEQAGT